MFDEAKRRNLELVKIGRTFSNTSDHVHKIMKILKKQPLLALESEIQKSGDMLL